MSCGKGSPKDNIYKTALELFSKKGYAGVGLREISGKADVNLSMISYYYNGKVGILKEIFENYFEIFCKMVEESLDTSLSIDENIRIFVRNTVEFFVREPYLVSIVHREFQFEIPELYEIKVNNMIKLQKLANKFVKFYGHGAGHSDSLVYTVFPSLTIMIFSNLQLNSMFRLIHKVPFDMKTIDEYSETIASTFLYGFINFKNEKLTLNNEAGCDQQ